MHIRRSALPVSAIFLITGASLSGCFSTKSSEIKKPDGTTEKTFSIDVNQSSGSVAPKATPVVNPTPAVNMATSETVEATPLPAPTSTATTEQKFDASPVGDFDKLFSSKEKAGVRDGGFDTLRYNRIVDFLNDNKENFIILSKKSPSQYKQVLNGLKDSVYCGGMGCFDPAANQAVVKGGFPKDSFIPLF